MEQEQFEKYQEFTEKTISDLSRRVTELEDKLNVISNLLEISKFINQYIKEPNLFSLINDMLMGVFGARYSTIYINESGSLEIAASNIEQTFEKDEMKLIQKNNREEFILNSESPIYVNHEKDENIYSCIGVPIKIDNRLIGYILVQHREKNYFTQFHTKFLSSIGNHIGVAIENNILHKQIRDAQ